jgi:hypothetical protein
MNEVNIFAVFAEGLGRSTKRVLRFRGKNCPSRPGFAKNTFAVAGGLGIEFLSAYAMVRNHEAVR